MPSSKRPRNGAARSGANAKVPRAATPGSRAGAAAKRPPVKKKTAAKRGAAPAAAPRRSPTAGSAPPGAMGVRGGAGLPAELERLRASVHALGTRLAQAEREHRELSTQFVALTEEHGDLLKLYVAGRQLHGAIDRAAALVALQEIVVNMIGSEEFGVFERDGAGRSPALVASMGIDPLWLQRAAASPGPIADALRSGRRYVAPAASVMPSAPGAARLTACIPFERDDEVVGAIAIYGLLPQKGALDPFDHALFDLLTSEAARALDVTATRYRAVAGGM